MRKETGIKDRDGRPIYMGDRVRRYGGGLLGDPSKPLATGVVIITDYGWKILDGDRLINMFNESELELIREAA